jgi:hypothetical protein
MTKATDAIDSRRVSAATQTSSAGALTVAIAPVGV